MRVADSGIATYSALIQGLTPFAVALERPWKANEPGVSCIPAGSYTCVRGTHRLASMDHDFETFEVMGVPGRSQILFHRGNLPEDSHGCILLGKAFNPVAGKPGITDSAAAFDEFMRVCRLANSFPLVIENAFPEVHA